MKLVTTVLALCFCLASAHVSGLDLTKPGTLKIELLEKLVPVEPSNELTPDEESKNSTQEQKLKAGRSLITTDATRLSLAGTYEQFYYDHVDAHHKIMQSVWSDSFSSQGTPTANELYFWICLLYTSPSPRDQRGSRMPSSA